MNLNTKLRYLTLAAGLAMLAGGASAMPAHPAPGTITQSDGSTVTVRVVGDEFRHYILTSDGYTVMRAADGDYKYAVKQGNVLVPGTVVAHEASARSAQEKAYLQSLGKLRPETDTNIQGAMRAARQSGGYGLLNRSANYDYHNFRGLVILVEYSDCQFSMSDPHTRFAEIVAKRDYTGFGDGFNRQDYTGSVVDYFYDNSFQQFEPQFDVVGPVQISKSMYYVNATENIRDVIREAIEKADPLVDFSQYDGDNNGEVDMFYVIFAGGSSNFSGNDSRLIWPHAWTMMGEVFDGKKLGRYACSGELYGPPDWKMIDGIGTICHEFSHVLGLMDEYDTDYEGSGGQSNHPGDWSLMASGGYLNQARTPTGYSLMQRYQSGFCVPVDIKEEGDYVLADLDGINNGFRINTSDPREYFLLENRRKDNKWNAYNHGQGMLVHRVDSTNPGIWASNNINANPAHNYYLLLRAQLKTNAYGVVDHDGDPFPGSTNATKLDYDTDPALVAWSGKGAEFVLRDIAEDEDGNVTFHAYPKKLTELTEDFEAMETSTKYDRDVPGTFTTWTFLTGQVDAPEGWEHGKAAGLFKNGSLETGVVAGKTNAVSITVYNPSSRPITFNVRYNTGGNNWDYLYEPSGLAGIACKSNESATYRFDIPQEYREDLRLQVRMANNSGSTTEKVYFDNFSFIQDPGENGPDSIEALEAANAQAATFAISNGVLEIATAAGETVTVCDLAGRVIFNGTALSGNTAVRLDGHGVYLLRAGSRTARVLY